jgi:hypothetical protein
MEAKPACDQRQSRPRVFVATLQTDRTEGCWGGSGSRPASKQSTTGFLAFPLLASKPSLTNPIFSAIAVRSTRQWTSGADRRAFFCAEPWQ